MKIYLIFLVGLLLPSAILAQVPNNDKIALETKRPSSQYYYPALFDRYIKGDSTLNSDDYHYLYYGYAFQDAYTPLEEDFDVSKIAGLLSKRTHSREEAETLLAFASDHMKKDPFSPTNLNLMTYAYGILGDTVNESLSAIRFGRVLETIKSSGDGLTEETPWHVLFYSHVNDVMDIMGLEIYRRLVKSDKVEYLALKTPQGKIKGYYFDYGRVYSKKPNNIPERRSQGIRIGNTMFPYKNRE